MKRLSVSLVVSLSLAAVVWSQSAAPTLSPEVRAFVREDAPVISLTHVRVIDGTGAAPRTDQTIIIANGKITAIGDDGTVYPPTGTKVLDLTGRTVIPGLVG